MSTGLLYHVASGQAFFSGAVLVLLGLLADLGGGEGWRALARNVLAFIGLLLIAVSATPLAVWVELPAWGVSLAWLGARASSQGAVRRWAPRLRPAVLAAWCVGLALEIPYHLTVSVPPMGDPSVYVVGDSLSAGLGDELQTWPDLLARRHDLRVHNLARAGATVATALRDQAGGVTGTAELVVLEIGGNDVLAGTPVPAFESGLDALLRRLAVARHMIVMLELPLPPFHEAYGRVQRRLARRHGAVLVPKRVLLGVLLARGSTLDTVHLGPAGHERMADQVWRTVRGAFRPRPVRVSTRDSRGGWSVMGLDLLDLVFRLERTFGLKIQRKDLERLARQNDPPDLLVGQLFDLVRGQTPRGGVLDHEVDAEAFWPLFQQQVVDALGIDPDEVTKDKRLFRDLGAS